MQTFSWSGGATLSYARSGNGAPLVLVHGSFSNHETNWAQVRPSFNQHFTVYTIARRGRGGTMTGPSLRDEAKALAAFLASLPEPACLLGHSYGAQVALSAAASAMSHIHKLVLYEPPWPDSASSKVRADLQAMAAASDFDGLAELFFREVLGMPAEELASFRASRAWTSVIADAEASLGDILALDSYPFDPADFQHLDLPVLLQIGSESLREAFATDALLDNLPIVEVQILQGQAHEAMNTAPRLYAESTIRFLLGN